MTGHRVAAALFALLLTLPASSVLAQTALDAVPGVVTALIVGDESRIVVVDPDGATRTLTSGAFDIWPVPAPDAARAAFVRVPDADTVDGELGLVDLGSGEVTMTGMPVSAGLRLMWEDQQTLISTTPQGIVRIRPDFRHAAFVPGTAANQVALDVRPGAILAFRYHQVAPEDYQLQLIELSGGAPHVVWTPPSMRYRVALAAYGPAGDIALMPTISSSGFGTAQDVWFLDPRARRAAAGDHVRRRRSDQPVHGSLLAPKRR